MKSGRTIFFAAVVLFICACPAIGTIHFNDGLIHDIDYEINQDVYVDYQTPSMYTTVNLPDGGKIQPPTPEPGLYAYGPYGPGLYGYEDSRINILGGFSRYLYSYDSSLVNISDGTVVRIESHGLSQVNITGNSDIIYVTFDNGICSFDSSKINISGGIIDSLYSYNSSQIDISGGYIISGLELYDQSMIQIFGSDFAVDDQPFGCGELTSLLGGSPLDEPYRHLTGTLLNGGFIDTGFWIGNDAKIVLVPEPTTITLFGIGFLFLRKRRERR